MRWKRQETDLFDKVGKAMVLEIQLAELFLAVRVWNILAIGVIGDRARKRVLEDFPVPNAVARSASVVYP